MKLFHASVEGAQHGGKGLEDFVRFAKAAGAAGCQPSNFMLNDPDNGDDGGLLPPAWIRDIFARHEMLLDGVSAHCPFWVHTTAWTGSKTIRPFLSEEVAKLSERAIEG